MACKIQCITNARNHQLGAHLCNSYLLELKTTNMYMYVLNRWNGANTCYIKLES